MASDFGPAHRRDLVEVAATRLLRALVVTADRIAISHRGLSG